MWLSEDLLKRLEDALGPINHDLPLNRALGTAGRDVMTTLESCKNAANLLTLEIDGKFFPPEYEKEKVAALKTALTVHQLSLETKLRALSKHSPHESFDPAVIERFADEVRSSTNQTLSPKFRHDIEIALTDKEGEDPLANFKTVARDAWKHYLVLALSAQPDPFELTQAARQLRNDMGQLAGADLKRTGPYVELYATIRNATSPNWGIGAQPSRPSGAARA